MQKSILISDAQVRPVGISVEEGMKALKCEIRKLAKTKSETFSYLCGEKVTYGEVAMTMAGFFAFMAAAVLGGFIMGGGGDVVMAKKISTKQLLETYKQVYPDVTSTTCSVSSEKDSFSTKTAFDLALKIGKMTHSYPLWVQVAKKKIVIIKSREFLKNLDRMKKGTRVRYFDPRHPEICCEGVIAKEGVLYSGAAPQIFVESEEYDADGETPVFAVFWRPMEEMSEK